MPFQFHYNPSIRTRFPQLRTGALLIDGVSAAADAGVVISGLTAIADQRLATGSESTFAEIQAWRQTFVAMGLKPTQYRCASESLLRRYRKERQLPSLHPLIDLCNATSLAFAIPIAAFDPERIAQPLTVRFAQGNETYESFSGETEHPEADEVIFADASHRAHARRWTHRQSGWSAISPTSTQAFIVSEALHSTAEKDVADLISSLCKWLRTVWPHCGIEKVELQ